MTRHALSALGALVLLLTLMIAGALPAAAMPDVSVTISPTTSSVVLGDNLEVAVAVTNSGDTATPPVVVHIDITNPDQSTSVDPEDWTPTLSMTSEPVEPGETRNFDWTIQPISPGSFVVYAVALSPRESTIAVSDVLEVSVDDQRSLNPGGILGLAIAAPAVIGALLLMQVRLSRGDSRRRGPTLARGQA